MSEPGRAEVCVVACAEAWRGDGAILASPMGLIPALGARLARLTFAPDLLLTDGEAYLVDAEGRVEGWLPYAKVFTMLAAGKRHVMMGAAQIDRFGNQNISAIGDWKRPGRAHRAEGDRRARQVLLPNPQRRIDHVEIIDEMMRPHHIRERRSAAGADLLRGRKDCSHLVLHRRAQIAQPRRGARGGNCAVLIGRIKG